MPAPSASTGMTLTNSFDVPEPHLQRQPVDPVVLAGLLQASAGRRERVRRIALTLSTSISPPTVPRKTT